jgi:hypothetical protein
MAVTARKMRGAGSLPPLFSSIQTPVALLQPVNNSNDPDSSEDKNKLCQITWLLVSSSHTHQNP